MKVLKKDDFEAQFNNNKAPGSNFKTEDTLINAKLIGTDYDYKHEVVWRNAIGFLILHLLDSLGLFLLITGEVRLKTFAWSVLIVLSTGEGVTIGAHRLFTHKSFKAKPALKAILILLQTAAGQNSILVWCRDHRLHHRYADTDADPHNAKRGFFFSHIGWLMTKKYPYVKELGKKIYMSDLKSDWMVQFQKKYYLPIYIVFAIILPVAVPVMYFGETFLTSFLIVYAYRYCYQNLQPVESWFVSFISLGEGWHNYHHAFPWDFKAAEIGMHFNVSADIIKFCETIGLAYDLKTAPLEMVKNRINKTGDGTHYDLGNNDAKASVTAIGPVHPLNPSYTSTYTPVTVLKPQGLPLFHEKDLID